ncbi:glycosyltransferase family 2 protein [Salinimicrobium sp. GXAS 041]|uniref:glycosyltransferase family 2 protein n=1 Tax=Salinimicrobium sp. GXAS 041 TaxID=3400806 RepID=UPI003C791B54
MDLVSIIIPTYNRAHLIGETLDSVLAQTYANWECIVVDDGSTDTTKELLERYCKRDKRFRYYLRPTNRPKGANACRNYGLEMSKGAYVNWFDSDDLMTTDHIGTKVMAIENSHKDFVVAQMANFNNGTVNQVKYKIREHGISAENFILRTILWYTCDIIIRRSIAEKISFNETIMFWQDYNYFCKMLLLTNNGIFLEKVLTYRRIHSDSMTASQELRTKRLIHLSYLTFIEIDGYISETVRKELVRNLMNLSFSLSKNREKNKFKKEIQKIVVENFGNTSHLWFLAALNAAYLFQKGEFFLEWSKRKEH